MLAVVWRKTSKCRAARLQKRWACSSVRETYQSLEKALKYMEQQTFSSSILFF
jgi:hypothetical protein